MYLEKIAEIIANVLDLKVEDITLDTEIADLSIDENDMEDIILELEKEYNTQIDRDDFESLDAVSDIDYYIQNKL